MDIGFLKIDTAINEFVQKCITEEIDLQQIAWYLIGSVLQPIQLKTIKDYRKEYSEAFVTEGEFKPMYNGAKLDPRYEPMFEEIVDACIMHINPIIKKAEDDGIDITHLFYAVISFLQLVFSGALLRSHNAGFKETNWDVCQSS